MTELIPSVSRINKYKQAQSPIKIKRFSNGFIKQNYAVFKGHIPPPVHIIDPHPLSSQGSRTHKETLAHLPYSLSVGRRLPSVSTVIIVVIAFNPVQTSISVKMLFFLINFIDSSQTSFFFSEKEQCFRWMADISKNLVSFFLLF